MGFWDSFRTGVSRGMGSPQQRQQAPPPADPSPDLPPGITVAPGLDVVVRGMIAEAHQEAGPIHDAPPPPIPGHHYKIVDVPGTWTRAISGSGHFGDVLERMPLGPVFVTLRLEPNEANRYGISAYVNGQQLGWLGTDWTANDPWVRFVTRLDKAGILPRFQGLHRLTGNTNSHIVNFDVPGREDGRLGDIARRITGTPAKPQ